MPSFVTTERRTRDAALDKWDYYEYNERGQVVKEYDVRSSGGVLEANSPVKASYDYGNNFGRLRSKTTGGVTTTYTQDPYGNFTRIACGTLGWFRRGWLSAFVRNNGAMYLYRYNHEGVRCRKEGEGVTTTYYYDGSKLLGENRVSGDTTTRIRYYYDAAGITGFSRNGANYRYAKDALGNVTRTI